jgi:hypothetical protein
MKIVHVFCSCNATILFDRFKKTKHVLMIWHSICILLVQICLGEIHTNNLVFNLIGLPILLIIMHTPNVHVSQNGQCSSFQVSSLDSTINLIMMLLK